jgi:tRNA pseudouridine38-40 synthase
VESALSRLFGAGIKLTGAGRTDSGVHSSGQVISFATDRPFELERLPLALNALLPPDCSVREAAEVEPGFSARFSARERTYVYAILNRRQRSALLARYAYHVPRRLDLAAMRSAAGHILGQHDFRSFCAADPGEPTVRTVNRLKIEARGELLRIEIAADGFLHHMVRTVVGTLLECGEGRTAADDLPAILAAADRTKAGATVPGRGLWLAGVRYDEYDSFGEPPLFRDAGGQSP